MAKQKQDKEPKNQGMHLPMFPQKMISVLADEVAKTLMQRLPTFQMPKRRKNSQKKTAKIENGLFLDTSAIIDGRIFEVVTLGLVSNPIVITQSILLELKHIADSQDAVKKERGRKGLELLEKLKKTKGVKVIVLPDGNEVLERKSKYQEVDERLIQMAKSQKGRIITCDYNLEKKATIDGVKTINMNALATVLKVTAVPGESLSIKVVHIGKDMTQGVAYLDDGTMIVIENGVDDVGKMADVVVSRVIQTAAGRILFAKKIQ